MAKLMAAATRRIGQLCGECVAPGGARATDAWVSTLRGLGFDSVRVIAAKPKLMKRDFVHQVMLQQDVAAATNMSDPTLDFVPDFSGVGPPLWKHGNDMLEPGTPAMPDSNPKGTSGGCHQAKAQR